jgi:hypothetical protein
LGFKLSNACTTPIEILEDRIMKANRMFQAIRTNCRVLGLSNVRIKIQLINSMVTSILLYGCVLYACLSNVESTMDPTNVAFAKAETFVRKMLRWACNSEYDVRKSFLYVPSN